MNWTAVIPIRFGAPRKSRLAALLTPSQREALADQLFGHVERTVRGHHNIQTTLILSPVRPVHIGDGWWPDRGSGLNAELTALREKLPEQNLLVIHADLPFLSSTDLSALIVSAEQHGIALAPDRVGEGTNAVAITAGSSLRFGFGVQSLARHRASNRHMGLVKTAGLAHDIDTPADLALATASGFDLRVKRLGIVSSLLPACTNEPLLTNLPTIPSMRAERGELELARPTGGRPESGSS